MKCQLKNVEQRGFLLQLVKLGEIRIVSQQEIICGEPQFVFRLDIRTPEVNSIFLFKIAWIRDIKTASLVEDNCKSLLIKAISRI